MVEVNRFDIYTHTALRGRFENLGNAIGRWRFQALLAGLWPWGEIPRRLKVAAEMGSEFRLLHGTSCTP